MRTLFSALALLPLVLAVQARADDPIIDGVFSEWASVPALATDPAGDSTGPIDFTLLKAQSRGSTLFIELETAATLNLASGTPTTTARLRIAHGAASLTVDFRNRFVYRNDNTASTATFSSVGFVELPTTAARQFEMKIDLSSIGAAPGETVQISLQGADTLAAAASFTLQDPPAPTPRARPTKPVCAGLRVISQNTLNNFTTNITGLNDPARRPLYVRLVRAMQPDVAVFQEEYTSTVAQVQSVLNEALPVSGGGSWNVLRGDDLALGSPYPLVQVTLGSAFLAAVVRAPAGDVLVITTHLKCCGYTGSSEDTTRISQTNTAVTNFNRFRAGTISTALAVYKNVPAILVGDWNLVGSETPLNLWLATPGPALTRALPRDLVGGESWTWASPDGLGFWPGILDLAVYDAARIRARGAFLLDTGELAPDDLAALGLQAGDSTASDHRMLVLDFATSAPCCRLDYNADGSLNPDDIGDFISDYFTVPSPPGGGGYATLCPQNAPPYGAGFRAAYTSDGMDFCATPNPDNLGDWITDYFLGC